MISTVGKRAMADDKQTLHISLIPEGGEVFKAVNYGRRMAGVIVFIALCFGAVLLTLLVVKGMERAATAKIDGLKAQIAGVKSETDRLTSDYEKISLLARQLKAAAPLLENHNSFLKAFTLVEEKTLPEVHYINFIGSGEGRAFVLEARAKSFEDAAKQIVAFREDARVERVTVSAMTADVKESGIIGSIKFILTLVLRSSALK